MPAVRSHAETPCPDLADLLLASEGELPKRRQAQVSAHLRVCRACRDQLGSIGLAIREYQDSASPSQVAVQAGAQATASRLDLFRARLDDERRLNSTRTNAIRKWLPIAAAVPVLMGALFFSDRYTSVIRAEELLTRAAAQEETTTRDTVRRVEIRVRRNAWSVRRDIGGGVVPATHASAGDEGQQQNIESAELARLMSAHHFDWDDPLSVRSFRAWRNSLSRRTDSVSTLGDALVLRTTTGEGALRSAEIVVRKIDFQPLRATLDFDGFGHVEIEEISRWVTTPTLIAERGPSPPNASIEVERPSAAALDEAEVDVRRTLHDLGVDWNPQVAVRRVGQGITVRARVEPRQKADIVRALAAITTVPVRVTVRMEDAKPNAALARPEGTTSTAPSLEDLPHINPSLSVPPLQRWLVRTFGSPERASQFLPALAADAEHLRHRATGFAALAARYPDSEVRQLPPDARKKLQALVDVQYRDLVKAIEALDNRLALFLGTSTRPIAGPGAPRPWQMCAEALNARLDPLDQAISDLVQASDLPLPTDLGEGRDEPATLSRLRQAADALWEPLRPASVPAT